MAGRGSSGWVPSVPCCYCDTLVGPTGQWFRVSRQECEDLDRSYRAGGGPGCSWLNSPSCEPPDTAPQRPRRPIDGSGSSRDDWPQIPSIHIARECCCCPEKLTVEKDASVAFDAYGTPPRVIKIARPGGPYGGTSVTPFKIAIRFRMPIPWDTAGLPWGGSAQRSLCSLSLQESSNKATAGGYEKWNSNKWNDALVSHPTGRALLKTFNKEQEEGCADKGPPLKKLELPDAPGRGANQMGDAFDRHFADYVFLIWLSVGSGCSFCKRSSVLMAGEFLPNLYNPVIWYRFSEEKEPPKLASDLVSILDDLKSRHDGKLEA